MHTCELKRLYDLYVWQSKSVANKCALAKPFFLWHRAHTHSHSHGQNRRSVPPRIWIWLNWNENWKTYVVRMINVFLLIKARTGPETCDSAYIFIFVRSNGSSVFTRNPCERAREYEMRIVYSIVLTTFVSDLCQASTQQCVGILMGCDISRQNTNELWIMSSLTRKKGTKYTCIHKVFVALAYAFNSHWIKCVLHKFMTVST